MVGAYDPNVGAFAFADPLFSQLNQAQQAATAAVRARFSNPFPVFNPQGDPAAETTAICALTPALQPRGRSPLRRRIPGSRRHRLGRIRLREPAVTMLAGQRRSGRGVLEAGHEAILAADSTTNGAVSDRGPGFHVRPPLTMSQARPRLQYRERLRKP